MTVYVETDFLVALAKGSDWSAGKAETVLENHDVETSTFAYLELLVITHRFDFDFSTVAPNLLKPVPAVPERDAQIVLKAARYHEDGLTPFDAFHAATISTRDIPLAGRIMTRLHPFVPVSDLAGKSQLILH